MVHVVFASRHRLTFPSVLYQYLYETQAPAEKLLTSEKVTEERTGCATAPDGHEPRPSP